MVLDDIIISLFIVFGASTLLSGQARCLNGVVVSEEDKEPLPFATVQVFQKGAFVQGVATDLAGRFSFGALPDSGDLDLQVDYSGYTTMKLTDVPVSADSLLIEITRVGHFCVIEMTTCGTPIIEPDNLTSGQTFTADQIRRQSIGSYYSECAVCRRNDREERRKKKQERRDRRKQTRIPENPK